MDLNEAIYGRRAVRAYASEPVSDRLLRQLIEAAVQAPSAMNEQPWLFTIVTDQALLARVSREAKAHILMAGTLGPNINRLRHMLEDPSYHIFYHAPALILISGEDGSFIIEDWSLAAQNLMLAAHAAGLGSCWIGFAQPWRATAEGKAALGLAQSHVPVAPIIVGRPESVPPAVQRKAPEIRWL